MKKVSVLVCPPIPLPKCIYPFNRKHGWLAELEHTSPQYQSYQIDGTDQMIFLLPLLNTNQLQLIYLKYMRLYVDMYVMRHTNTTSKCFNIEIHWRDSN